MLPLMTEKSAEDAICDLIKARMNWQPGQSFFQSQMLPFDISKPNFHDSKKEFLFERDTVQGAIEHLVAALSLLFRPSDESDAEYDRMITSLRGAISRSAFRSTERRSLSSASDLALKNIVETGFFYNSGLVNYRLLVALEERLQELDRQEKEFWSVSHRPPNYYARTIALRFAKFFARQMQTKPTFGISREGSHPSTEYGRLLEEIFNILEIKAHVRGAAEWAISQITDDDMKPPQGALGSILGYGGLGGVAASKPSVKSIEKNVVSDDE